jgi:hypothetical protein
MKRKVRITPPDSNPFESNNMSTWMAEMGGAKPKQENQIVYAAAEMLSQGIPQDEVVATLTEQGIPVAIVDEVMNSLYQYVEEQRDLSEANYSEDKLAQEQILADQEMAQRDMMYEQDMSEDDSPMYYSPDTDPGYAEEDAVMDEVLMKFGGKIPTKGEYIKKQLKLKRKQDGGPEESNKADDTLSEKRPINKFIQKVTEIAQEKSDKESLEEEYNQMFGNQMFGDENLPEAQFGGARNARRAQRQLNRATRKMNRMLPNGFNALSQFMPSQPNIVGGLGMFQQNFGINPMMGQNLQLANIDVHRSGLFGKPKEYTINFNTAAPVKNEYNDLVKQEEKNVETTVKEIEEKEKEKETTTASTENKKVQEELITADQIQVVDSGKNKTQNTTSTKPQLKKDAWGRSEDDEWYGFDPNQNNSSTRDVVQPIIDYAKRPQGPKIGDVQTTSWTDDSIDPNSELGKLIKLKEDFAHMGVSEKENPALVDINKRINDLKNKSSINKTKTGKSTASTSNSSIFQNPYLKFANNFLFQKGGFTDQNSGLYKFIGGGDDSMIPFADESFRTDSKDTTDPNFQYGGLYPAIFNNRRNKGINRFRPPGRAIEYAGSYLQQQGVPIDPVTGQPIKGISNPQLKSIKTENGLFNINPKNVTYTYTGQAPEGTGFGTFNTGFEPRKDWNTPYSPQGAQYNNTSKNRTKSDNKLPGAFGPRNDEFMQNLWERRAKRKGYDIDWSTEGMVSPEDYQQPKLPLRRDLLPTIADEAREPIVRDFSTSNNTSLLNPELLPTQDYTDEELKELGMDEIVDVQPEDLSQYANQFSTVNNLPIKRPYSEEQAQMLQNFAPYMKEDSYSKINELDRIEAQDFELEKLMNQDRPLNTFAGNMADYDLGNSNIPINMPGSDPYNAEIKRQQAIQRQAAIQRQEAARRNIEKQKEQVKNQTRREVKQQDNSLTTEPTVTKPVTAKPMTREQKRYQQKIITRIQQINELLSEFQPESIKSQLEEERESLSKGDFSKTSSFFRQYGGTNYTYPQLPVAQTIGQFNMSTPYANKNTALMPSAESMVTNPFAMDANYQNPLTGASPAIRMGTDGEYVNEGVLTDEDLAKLNQKDMSIDYKVKNMYNIDGPRLNDNINTGVRFGESLINAYRNMGIQDDFNQNLTSDNIDAVKQTLDQGTYDPNSGLRTPNKMGFTGVAQYGGYMQEGGDMYDDDSVTWMSEDQVRQFLAEGGELEFIQE